jgi:hypothetical protein
MLRLKIAFMPQRVPRWMRLAREPGAGSGAKESGEQGLS